MAIFVLFCSFLILYCKNESAVLASSSAHLFHGEGTVHSSTVHTNGAFVMVEYSRRKCEECKTQRHRRLLPTFYSANKMDDALQLEITQKQGRVLGGKRSKEDMRHKGSRKKGGSLNNDTRHSKEGEEEDEDDEEEEGMFHTDYNAPKTHPPKNNRR